MASPVCVGMENTGHAFVRQKTPRLYDLNCTSLLLYLTTANDYDVKTTIDPCCKP